MYPHDFYSCVKKRVQESQLRACLTFSLFSAKKSPTTFARTKFVIPVESAIPTFLSIENLGIDIFCPPPPPPHPHLAIHFPSRDVPDSHPFNVNFIIHIVAIIIIIVGYMRYRRYIWKKKTQRERGVPTGWLKGWGKVGMRAKTRARQYTRAFISEKGSFDSLFILWLLLRLYYIHPFV